MANQAVEAPVPQTSFAGVDVASQLAGGQNPTSAPALGHVVADQVPTQQLAVLGVGLPASDEPTGSPTPCALALAVNGNLATTTS